MASRLVVAKAAFSGIEDSSSPPFYGEVGNEREAVMEAIAIFWLASGVAAGLIYGLRTKRAGGFVTGMATVILLGPVGVMLALTETPQGKPPNP